PSPRHIERCPSATAQRAALMSTIAGRARASSKPIDTRGQPTGKAAAMRIHRLAAVLLFLALAPQSANAGPYTGVICRTLPTWSQCVACGAAKYGRHAQERHCAGLPGTPARLRK